MKDEIAQLKGLSSLEQPHVALKAVLALASANVELDERALEYCDLTLYRSELVNLSRLPRRRRASNYGVFVVTVCLHALQPSHRWVDRR